MDRRDVLRAIGATGVLGATTALAGCNEYVGGRPPSGERAPHDGWVGSASATDGAVGAISLDLEMLYGLQDDAEATTTETETEATTAAERAADPLSGIPASYLVAVAFAIGFGLRGTGVQDLVQEDGDGELVTFTRQAIVIEGSFTATSVEAAVADAGASKVEDHEGYAIYREESTESGVAIAVSDDAAMVVYGIDDGDGDGGGDGDGEGDGDEGTSTDGAGADPVATAKQIVDVHEGSADRYSSTVEAYDDLVTALPDRGLVGVEFDETGGLFTAEDGETAEDEDPAFSGLQEFSDVELEGDSLGGAVSVAFSSQELEVALAIRYASADEVDETDAIEDAIGRTASSRDITVDGPMLYVEGTFRESTLETQ